MLLSSNLLSIVNFPTRVQNQFNKAVYIIFIDIPKLKLKLRVFSPQANYTDRATATCRRS
jgi:hypothetical protein